MSHSENPRPYMPWAVLALIPLALAAVWWISRLPEPSPSSTRTAASTSDSPAASPGIGSPETGSPPAGDAAPKPEAVDAERSEWSSAQEAMAESQRTGKPVMLEFTAEWSPEGIRLRTDVFGSSILGDAVQRAVIPVAVIDREREEGENPPQVAALKEQFKVTSLPTLVVFSARTGRIVSTQGFHGADETVRWIRSAAEAVR